MYEDFGNRWHPSRPPSKEKENVLLAVSQCIEAMDQLRDYHNRECIEKLFREIGAEGSFGQFEHGIGEG